MSSSGHYAPRKHVKFVIISFELFVAGDGYLFNFLRKFIKFTKFIPVSTGLTHLEHTLCFVVLHVILQVRQVYTCLVRVVVYPESSS